MYAEKQSRQDHGYASAGAMPQAVGAIHEDHANIRDALARLDERMGHLGERLMPLCRQTGLSEPNGSDKAGTARSRMGSELSGFAAQINAYAGQISALLDVLEV